MPERRKPMLAGPRCSTARASITGTQSALPIGSWNVYEITAKGDTFTVVLSGQKTVAGAKSDKFASGRIALQHGKGATDESVVVKFRKLKIKPM
jgi:hypothetical protein